MRPCSLQAVNGMSSSVVEAHDDGSPAAEQQRMAAVRARAWRRGHRRAREGRFELAQGTSTSTRRTCRSITSLVSSSSSPTAAQATCSTECRCRALGLLRRGKQAICLSPEWLLFVGDFVFCLLFPCFASPISNTLLESVYATQTLLHDVMITNLTGLPLASYS
jgi:hypothetical protein